MCQKNDWPAAPSTGPVEVYVDWMNLYLAEQHVFEGETPVIAHLEYISKMAKRLSSGPRRVYIYLNVGVFKSRCPFDMVKLISGCSRMRFTIVDVPLVDGKDQVDPAMISDMLWHNRAEPSDITFLFISADRGFAPMLAEIRRSRAIYIGLPTTSRVPLLGKAATGWNWVHPLAWRYVAIYDAMNPEQVSMQYRVNDLVETYPEYCLGLALSERCLLAVAKNPACVSIDALRARVAESIASFAWRPDHERNIELLVGALKFYEIVSQHNRSVTINRNHRAFQNRKKPNRSPARQLAIRLG